MKFPHLGFGFGPPPKAWIQALSVKMTAKILDDYMKTQTRPTTSPTNRHGTDRMSDGFGHGGTVREIKQMCSDRMVTPDKWIELARESPVAAAAVKASLMKVPVVPNQIR